MDNRANQKNPNNYQTKGYSSKPSGWNSKYQNRFLRKKQSTNLINLRFVVIVKPKIVHVQGGARFQVQTNESQQRSVLQK